MQLQLQFCFFFRSKQSFRMLYDFDLNEAIVVMILSHKCFIVVVKVLNPLIRENVGL